ncbi:sortase A [Leucobacter exalbidus]|uniref:Sortase A n=1 Tax=Leucobacter exalbidus TaxID=662960 RepID=A0A940T4N0_9MICO|nr:class C sortase [Leucobacter exalbidus]MBP1327108.1 sortase A [Leucobacter exalbidus]
MPTHEQQQRWRWPRFVTLTTGIAIAGLLLFMYPSIASWFAQLNQSQVVQSVNSTMRADSNTDLTTELDRARAYNESLVGGALVGAHSNVPTSAEGDSAAQDDGDYEALLRGDAAGTMGRLRIPAIAADLPIYHGTSDETLAKGVGHLQGTSLPVGGASQHSVLTAHRGLADAQMFTQLDRVKQGDTFTIEVFGEVITYRVFDTQVVKPEDTESLYPVYGDDLVTLVTCTPIGINSHRILVTGERVTPTPQADLDRAGEVPNIPGFPWWAVGLGAAVLGAGAYIWLAGRLPRAKTRGSGSVHALAAAPVESRS